MKRLFILTTFLLSISPICLNAQELTLEKCQQQARAHYPLIKWYGLIEKTKEYNISNIDKGYLPQVSLSAKASYQSDDRSSCSTRLVQKVGASEYFHLIDISNNYQEVMQCIEKGDVDLILEIPPHLERDLLKNGMAKVLISSNTVNGTKGTLGSSYLSNILCLRNPNVPFRLYFSLPGNKYRYPRTFQPLFGL